MTGEQADLFAEAPARPAGLHYRDDFIDPAEERSLLDAIGALALTEARYKAYTAKRRIASFGSSYDFDANVARDAPPLPALDVRPRSG